MKNTMKPLKKNIRTSLFFFLLILLCFVVFRPLLSSSYMAETNEDEVEEVNVEDSIEFTSSSELHDMINFNIFEDIIRAKALLEKEQCGFQVVKSRKIVKSKKVVKSKKTVKGKKDGRGKKANKPKTVEKNELGEFTILLAIENVKTRDIQVVRVHPTLGAQSEGVVVERGKSNGVNTKFTIVYPEQHVVLAIKRPVRQGTTFKEVVYTPYSDGLDIPEVRKAGLEYLKNTLGMAKNDLVERKVRPLSCNEFIADDVSLTLAIIEHIDPLKFESGKYTTKKLIHETLVIMGTNKQSAYRYSASKAGARGLFQFIPDTYKRIVKLYPQAGLKKDFIQGMEDHENAAKASFLLFDADMRVLNNGRKERIMNDPQTLGRFLASAYNCGSGKTKGAMDRYGGNWSSRVPAETQIYLKKYDAVWDWLHRQPQAIQ
ncbi:MAG: transglycosylase SLT domain-containing protein [Proteobacteria bacterium]|nr:transglycosylase SLT domain-containing protein [Pseudomonadota bacterium]